MSKTLEAKKAQNYQVKPLQRRCRVCKNFRSTIYKDRWGYDTEKKLRCKIGDFMVKPNSVCDMFERESK